MERPDQELQRPAAVAQPKAHPSWGKGAGKAGKGKGGGKAAMLMKGFAFEDAPMPMNVVSGGGDLNDLEAAVGAEESAARVDDVDERNQDQREVYAILAR